MIRTLLIFMIFFSSFAFAKESTPFQSDKGYTINYENVSIKEYIDFVSKITGVNFIFSDEELNFNVTVVSEDPITTENVMSTLVQVLRIRNLELLEEDNNLVIHTNPNVKQISHLAFGDDEMDTRYPITTRVFRIRDGKANSIAAIIKPMISETSILETIPDANQIILTDVTTNVEKVALLIQNLDAPASQFTIEAYHVKNNDAAFLINMTSQIMAPLTQGHPYILVPQSKSNVIFIVSTSSLVEKTVSVLANLDKKEASKGSLNPDNVFIYKIQNRSLGEMLRGIQAIENSIRKDGYAEKGLLETLSSVKPIKESRSLIFTGNPAALAKVREIVSIMDVATLSDISDARESFFLYIPIHCTPEKIETGIQEVVKRLDASKVKDQELLETLGSVKVVHSTQSLVFTGDSNTFDRVKEILNSVDIPDKCAEDGKSTYFVYKVKNISASQLEDSLKELANNLEKSGVKEQSLVNLIHSMKYMSETNSIMFTGGKKAIEQLKEILPNFDKPLQGREVSSQFLVYKPKYLHGDQIYKALKEYEKNLSDSGLTDPGLMQALSSMKWTKSTNSLLFTGDPASLQKVDGLIESIDARGDGPGHEKGFFVYQLQYAPKDKVKEYLEEVAKTLTKKGLPETDLIDAIHSMKWIKQSHSFMFTGTQNSLGRIKVFLTDFDVPSEKAIAKAEPAFVLYQPQNISKEMAENYLNQIAQHLNRKNEKQGNLYDAIESMKWIKQSSSFMFSGTQDALNEVLDLLKDYDVEGQKGYQQSFFTYQLKFVSKTRFEKYLNGLAKNLKKTGSDPSLVEAIKSMKWIPDSKSFVFSGAEASLTKLRKIIDDYDISAEKDSGDSYFIYKLQYASGDEIEEDLARFSKNMKDAGLADNKMVHVIDNIKWVKATNSLLLTGDPDAVLEVKELIQQYDIQERPGKVHTDFFMYKPKHLSAKALEQSMEDILDNLREGGLKDKSLLTALQSVKYSSKTDSLIFTGTPEALQKLEALVKEIDVPSAKEASIQKLGKTTFLLYKLKNASGTQVIQSIKNVTNDLKKSSTTDKKFLKALNSMKYIRETNSLLFTGNEEALEKVRNLVDKFDLSSLEKKSEGPKDFFIYKPHYVPGTQLEQLLIEFIDHLKDTGLTDPKLFRSVQTMKYVEKNNNLIFTGDQKTIAKIKDLLATFDVPTGALPAGQTEIQDIDNTSFLVYKLQYHKGTEIQAALKQIAKDLTENKTPVNEGLLNAIRSIQWLQITNSLLCTGDQQTLTRLKELIKNLDVPLKQVFIEVLAIETSLSNFLDFGLSWGSKGKYKDRFAASTSNFSSTANSSNSGTNFFASQLSNISDSVTPSPTSIPFQTGFDFGVIGDMIFHKGRSFLSLGSLLNALQIETETSILLTPKIIGQDSKTSNLFVGQNIPFVGSFVQNISQSTLNTSNVEYRDIGLNLTITPVLGNSDIITLDINIENSVVATDSQGQATNVSVGGVEAITTNKTNMQTTVHVPNEHFVVLSGMLDLTKRRSTNGIPCLGGIPVIGAAFSLLEKTDNRNNIVIFIRPRIINSYDDIKQVTRENEETFREESGSTFLETQFDEGMELIKSVDDE